MNYDRIKELVTLADEANILKDGKIQTLLFTMGLDDDKELFGDVREYFTLTSPNNSCICSRYCWN